MVMRVEEFEVVDDDLERSISEALGESAPYVSIGPMEAPPPRRGAWIVAVILALVVGVGAGAFLVSTTRPHAVELRHVAHVEVQTPPECTTAMTFADRFMASAADLSQRQTSAVRAAVNNEPLHTRQIGVLTEDLIEAIDRYEVARDTCLDAV